MQPVTLNSLIASAIVNCPKQQVTFKTLKQITKNMFTHLTDKRVRTFVNNAPTNHDIEQAALSLGFQIKGNPTDKSKGDKAILDLRAKEDSLLKLSLSYYKNQLCPFWINEAIVVQAISYLVRDRDLTDKLTVTLDDIV